MDVSSSIQKGEQVFPFGELEKQGGQPCVKDNNQDPFHVVQMLNTVSRKTITV
jgi:hypothetical protein